MSFDFSDSRFVSRNGKQSPLHREHAISSSIKRGSFFNFKASPKRMETKIFLTIFSLIGVGSYIGGMLLNLSNFKSDILFWVGFGFIVLKFVGRLIKTWQAYKREEIEQQILKRKIDNSEE